VLRLNANTAEAVKAKELTDERNSKKVSNKKYHKYINKYIIFYIANIMGNKDRLWSTYFIKWRTIYIKRLLRANKKVLKNTSKYKN
jgi:mRNA-degrading endonuclease HigB of HigAB toxin-antitoxin module